MSTPVFAAAALLRRVPWLAALGPEAIDELAHQAIRKGARKGATVARAGSGGDLMLLVSGCLELTRLGDPLARAQPRRLWPGDFVGLALIAGEPHPLDVVAVESCSLLVLPLTLVRTLLLRQPEVTLRAMARLAEVVTVRGLPSMEEPPPSLTRRVVEALVELARGRRAVEVTRDQLAERLGVSRDAVGKELTALEDAGRVIMRRGRIELISLARG